MKYLLTTAATLAALTLTFYTASATDDLSDTSAAVAFALTYIEYCENKEIDLQHIRFAQTWKLARPVEVQTEQNKLLQMYPSRPFASIAPLWCALVKSKIPKSMGE